MRLIASLGLALSLAMAGTAPAQEPGVTDTEILIGDILPISGAAALLGFAHTLGVKAAVAEVNAEGGINGRMVRTITEDDGYVNTRTIEGMKRLLNVQKVFALTSISGSTQGLGVLSMVKNAGVPAVTTISYAREMYDPVNENIYVIGSDHDVLAEMVTTRLTEMYPDRPWGVIVQDDAYGTLMKEGFDRAVEKLGLEVVYSDKYARGQRDFSSEMQRLAASGAQVFLMGGVIGENVTMARELERLGVDIPFGMNFVGRVPMLLELMGPVGKNAYVGDYVATEDSEAGRAFLEKVSKYLSEEEMAQVNRFTFTGYLGTAVLFEAMRRCGAELTRKCTIEQMDAMKDFDAGISSPLSFSTDDHYAMLELQLMQGNPETGTFVPVD